MSRLVSPNYVLLFLMHFYNMSASIFTISEKANGERRLAIFCDLNWQLTHSIGVPLSEVEAERPDPRMNAIGRTIPSTLQIPCSLPLHTVSLSSFHVLGGVTHPQMAESQRVSRRRPHPYLMSTSFLCRRPRVQLTYPR